MRLRIVVPRCLELVNGVVGFQIGRIRIETLIEQERPNVVMVYGDTDEAMAFGLGYASAEDRMWQMDVFRHVARGEGASFVGDSFLGSDRVARRDGYTEPELQKMFDELAHDVIESARKIAVQLMTRCVEAVRGTRARVLVNDRLDVALADDAVDGRVLRHPG